MNQILPSLCAAALLAGGACPITVGACPKPVAVRTVRVVAVTPCGDYYVPPLPPGMQVSCCRDAFRDPYRISYPPLCPLTPSAELVNVGHTPQALAIRRTAILRQRENVRFERELLASSTPIEQPSYTGTVIFGETEGAGSFQSGGGCPPPAPPYPGPTLGSGGVRAVVRSAPPAVVGEQIILAAPVAGKPGFCTSPYSRSTVYIDVRGLAPGSLARDPFSGRTFRVP